MEGAVMHKIIVLTGMILFLGAGFCLADESLTITTYYPSPHGTYNELRTKKTVIGDINSATTPTPSDGAVTLMPTSQPSSYSRGTLYFDNSESKFKYYNGSAWKTLGSSGYTQICIGTVCCTIGTDCSNSGPGSGTSCTLHQLSCPGCFPPIYGMVQTWSDGRAECHPAECCTSDYSGCSACAYGCWGGAGVPCTLRP